MAKNLKSFFIVSEKFTENFLKPLYFWNKNTEKRFLTHFNTFSVLPTPCMGSFCILSFGTFIYKVLFQKYESPKKGANIIIFGENS